MTLLNGLLAFGAAAFTIPLIIHLLHRSRYQTIDWGAMHLLQSSRNLNSRRIQWQQLLLLLLRCALPVLLALAMARPLLQSFLSADGRSPMSLVIVLDDSMSMFATDRKRDGVSNPTRFSAACQSAAELLKELPAGSNSMVLLGGSPSQALPGQVPDELSMKLLELNKRSVPAGEFGFEESIRSSLQWLATSPHPRRQLVLISDFQKHEWSDLNNAKMSDLAKLIASQSVVPELSFVSINSANVSIASSQPSNLSVDSVDVFPSLLAVGRECTISTTLGNQGTKKSDGVGVVILVNDIEIERQEVTLAAASTTQIRSRWSPKQTGDHVIRVQILQDDDLIADNSLSTAAIVQEPIPILLVDGDRRSDSMQSETDFLRLALSPFSLLTGEKGDIFLSKAIQPDELNESILKKYRTVCLCNVSEVTDVQQKSLHDFVEQGNGLVVFLGDKVRTEQYQTWPTLANSGLRIANFAARKKVPTDSAAGLDMKPESGEVVFGAGGRVKTQAVEFGPVRELSLVSLTSLAGVRFEYRTPIELDPAALTNASDGSVAMRFEDDQAWILESQIGKGRCLWISTACDDDDSNLPTRSIFVPLVQKLVAYVCAVDPPETEVFASEGWTRMVGVQKSNIEDAPREVRVTKPDGKAVRVPLSGDRVMRFSDTRLLGTYSAKLVDVDKEPIGPIKGEPNSSNLDQMVVCVRSQDWRSGNESKLAYLTNEEMATLSTLFNSTVSASSSELLSVSHADWHGREVWTWIWTALVLCFLAEIALEQSLSPRLKSKLNAASRQIAKGTVG